MRAWVGSMEEWCDVDNGLVRAFDVVVIDGKVSRLWAVGAEETIGLLVDQELVTWAERRGQGQDGGARQAGGAAGQGAPGVGLQARCRRGDGAVKVWVGTLEDWNAHVESCDGADVAVLDGEVVWLRGDGLQLVVWEERLQSEAGIVTDAGQAGST